MMEITARNAPCMNFSFPDNETFFNQTDDSLNPIWSFSSLSTLGVCITGIICNTILRITYARNSHLRSPFSIYVMNLLLANEMYLLLDNPFDVVRDLYQTWPLGPAISVRFLCSRQRFHLPELCTHI